MSRKFWAWRVVLFHIIQTSSLEDQRAHTVTASVFGILHLWYIRDQAWTTSTLCRINHLHLFLTSLFGEPQNKSGFKIKSAVSKTIRIFFFSTCTHTRWCGHLCITNLSGPQNPDCIWCSLLLRYKFGLDASWEMFKPLMNHKNSAYFFFFQ